jgi:hypothetical protein
VARKPETFLEEMKHSLFADATNRPLIAFVIPAQAGIHFLPDMDPRFRGGDVLTFISMGGPLAHGHPE